MSENQENKQMEVKVTVDRSFELEKLREEKDAKIAELEGALSTIAEKTFRATEKRLGLSGLDPNNPDDIETIKAASLGTGTTAQLNQYQVGGSQNDDGFDTIEQGILSLNELAKTDEGIHKELGKVAKRALKPKVGSFDYELEPTLNSQTGKLGCLQNFRKPVRVGIETANPEQNYEERVKKTKLSQKWSKKD